MRPTPPLATTAHRRHHPTTPPLSLSQSLLVTAGEALQAIWSALLAKRAHPRLWLAVLALHSSFCAPLLADLRPHWLLHLSATLAWAYGGGTVTALVAGDRTRAPLAVLAGNDVMLVWMPVWWLLNHAPGGVAERLRALLTRRPCAALARGSTALLRATLIVGRVDLAVTYLYPGSAAGALLFGTLAGVGGRLLADAFRHASSLPPLPGPHGAAPELSAPGFTTRSAFLASLAHLLLAYGPLADGKGALLPSRAASAGIVVGLLVLQSVLSDLLGRPLDATRPLAEMVHRLTAVPLPPVKGGGRGRASGARPANKARQSDAEEEEQQVAAVVRTPRRAAAARGGASRRGAAAT